MMRRHASARGAGFVVALLAGLCAIPMLAEPSSAATSCGAAPKGQTSVMLTVDTGSGTPSSGCVTVPDGVTGLDVLNRAGHHPRLDAENPGFVCAIDGFPATGCGETVGSDYEYWSYWHSTDGTWSYSTLGAAVYRLPAGCVGEGWRWMAAGSGASSDQPPRTPGISGCAAPVAVPPGGLNGGQGSGAASRAGNGGSPTTPSSMMPGAAPSAAAPPVAPQPGATRPGAAPTGAPQAGASPPSTAPTGAVSPGTGAPLGATSSSLPAGVAIIDGAVIERRASSTKPSGADPRKPVVLTSATKPGSGASPLLWLLAVGAVGLLGAVAAVRFRGERS